MPTHPQFQNLLGRTFGYLEVLDYRGNNKHGKALWLCRCKCGNEKVFIGSQLIGGHSQSCGCYKSSYQAEKWKEKLPSYDIAGHRFGRLEVVRFSERRSGEPYWLCKCDCGSEKAIAGSSLKKGISQSCGCLMRELSKERNTRRLLRHGHAVNGRVTPEYRAWHAMIERCRNPNVKQFKDYGGRGISVCERWREFEKFYADMGDRPGDDYSLDRVNNSGNYEPGNCEWRQEVPQARNRRSNRMVEFGGETRCLAEWCEILDKSYQTVLERLLAGWSPHLALTTPSKQYRGTKSGSPVLK